MQEGALATPESGSPATWYGSAIHEAIDALEDGLSDDAAIELAWSKWGAHLLPDDLALLHADLEQFRTRDFQNVRTILAEGEIRVPLTETEDGQPIWFRARIDRLYERLDRPGSFIHVDYKSGKWIKSQDEVDADLQLWSYNWLICEFFPEVEDLEQWLDQLRGGMVPTRKGDAQRDQIREWLAVEARGYFSEHETRQDGLPAPRFNQWCPWCPILESCEIVPTLSDWALARIATLRPEGMAATDEVAEATPLDQYLDRYDDVKTAMATLERFQESARKLVRELPDERRRELGFELRDRRNSVIGVQAREALYQGLGHEKFMELAGITQERLKSVLTDEEQRDWALSLVDKVPGNKVVHRVKGG